jgi:16S rRNA (adenine1518-N6/adenine1519-N6)-dimethyltransferase
VTGGPPKLSAEVRRLGLSPNKRLGQHFLFDPSILGRIAAAAGDLGGATVLEVGPGPGGLTRALLGAGSRAVIAVERDPRFVTLLRELEARAGGRLTVLESDALDLDLGAVAAGAQLRIVANLPYNVATALVFRWFERLDRIERMVLMFQKEVAERIVAAPASKAYGRLAVIAQWRTRPRLAFTVGPAAFTPAPAVASAVVEFTPIEKPAPECRVETLGAVTAAAFGQRRKMLRQSLRSLTAEPEKLLAAAGITATLRAEALSVRDFARLAYVFERLAK